MFDLLHALYEIRVVDGKTFDIIEKLAAGPLDNASTVRLPGPSLMLDTGFDERDDNLHRAVADLVVRSLPNTLDRYASDQSEAANERISASPQR